MRQIETHQSGPRVVVDLDGRLDAVNGFDLLRTVNALYSDGSGHVHLDLSQITEADVDGVAALAACSELANSRGCVLTWSRCSRPLLLALQTNPYTRGRS